ncbi:MAG: AfsR/SARP family transcriptional regulator [Acidimicrobiales bacterium]
MSGRDLSATETAIRNGVDTAALFATLDAVKATPVRVHVVLLGRFEVRVDGRPIPPGEWARRHSAALVKLLALTPTRSLHREQVIDALWPDLTVKDAAPRLHKAAHYARKALGFRDAVVLVADSVRLCPYAEVHVDAIEFQHLAQAATAQGGTAPAKATLAAYGGQLLPLDIYETWTEQPREHLGRLHHDLLRQSGDWHRILAADPADEEAHLALMHRHAANGDRSAALRQFERLDRAMRHELGLEPGEKALALRDQILTTAVPAAHRRAPSLPRPVGHDHEIIGGERSEVQDSTAHSRAAFVPGPTGVGKPSVLSWLTRRVAADLCRQNPTLLDGLADIYREEIDRIFESAGLDWADIADSSADAPATAGVHTAQAANCEPRLAVAMWR